MVPVEDIVRPAGSPVAVNVYGAPAPPVAVIVAGVIATPCTALITTHDAVGFPGAVGQARSSLLILNSSSGEVSDASAAMTSTLPWTLPPLMSAQRDELKV